jgi:RHS repeat-associated protein
VISIVDLGNEANYYVHPCPAQKTSYLYDGLGNLVKRSSVDTTVYPNPPATWTEYIDGIYEKTNTGAVTKYYGAFGRAVAVRQVPTGTGAGTLTYLLADHLGSTVRAIDAATGAVTTAKYWPYGAPRSGAIAQTDKLYTGQQQEPLTTAQTPLQGATDALGTYFYHARFYSTVTGRFVSADTLAVDGLNRYAYVRNSPMNYSDPTGQCILGLKCEAVDAANWIRWALTDTGAAGDWGRSALRSADFWSNVYTANGTCGCGTAFVTQIMATIGRNARPGTLDYIPDIGYRILSLLLGMDPAASVFLRASLSDLLFGTSEVSTMDAARIEGASPWWEEIGNMMKAIEGGYSIADSPWHDKVFGDFIDKTIELGTALQVDGKDLQRRDWSRKQWGIIRGKFHVNPPEDFDPSGCVTDPTCISAWYRFFSGSPMLPGEDPTR